MSQVFAARVRVRRLVVLAVLGVLGAVSLQHGAVARADGPGSGSPWVASVGDSYISGEAGRWAGSTNDDSSEVDALGATAYDDNASGSAEQISGCHRSKSAEVHIGGGVSGVNFACSGAKTSTSDGDSFKPGLDFYSNGGKQGQALMLQTFAATHNVKMIALSIGGNNFNFASIVQSCVVDWLTSPTWWKDYCNDDSSVKANFTSANVTAQTTAIRNAILNIAAAMANAGYAASQYTILVQDYESPIPPGSAFRYSESGYTRQSTGGCGFWNNDANWANTTALPTINNAVKNAAAQTGLANVKVLELQSAFNGRRLCENTVGLLEEKGLSSWTQAGAVDKTEWINEIRTVSTVFGPYQVQESLHPNYWGQLALRSCVRQAYNGGAPRGGTCTIAGTGLSVAGEPKMGLN
jgi:hypothetical protein